jgi:hypothetical protein
VLLIVGIVRDPNVRQFYNEASFFMSKVYSVSLHDARTGREIPIADLSSPILLEYFHDRFDPEYFNATCLWWDSFSTDADGVADHWFITCSGSEGCAFTSGWSKVGGTAYNLVISN